MPQVDVLRESPPGKAPALIEKVYGVVPPVALHVAE